MKELKILLLIVSLLCVIFVESNAQGIPTSCQLITYDQSVPWNQSPITGYFDINYYYSNPNPVSGYLNLTWSSGMTLNSWSGFPTRIYYTVNGPGTYNVSAWITYYMTNGGNAQNSTPSHGTITITVIPTHGNTSASAYRDTRGEIRGVNTSSYISPGSNVAWSLHIRIQNYIGGTSCSATAEILIPGNSHLHGQTNQVNGLIDQTLTGSISNFAGGTINLSTEASSNGGGYGLGEASITW
jgi:hypothetical protein